MIKYLFILLLALSCNSKNPDLAPLSSIGNNAPVDQGFNFFGITYIATNLDSSVTINWAPHADAVFYDLFDVTSGSSTLLNSINAPATSYNLTGLTVGQTYVLRLKARKADGFTDANTHDVSVTVPQPFVFAGINSITANPDSTVTIQWTLQGSAAGYDLYFVNAGNPIFWKSLMPIVSSHTTTPLTPGMSYTFRLKARRADGVSDNNTNDVSVVILEGEKFVKLAPGAHHTCGLTALGNTYCWGDNAYGQLGDNTTVAKLIPNPVNTMNFLSGEKFIDIDSGTYYTCGLTNYGKVLCWGQNTYGNLGQTGPKTVPTVMNMINLAANETFKSLSIGYQHSCGITNLGKTYCWGDNSSGQVGDNSTVNKDKPVVVAMTNLAVGERFVTISAGSNSTCGVTTLGNAFCWGKNNAGQLGDATLVDKLIPTAVSLTSLSAGERFHSISVGGSFACGITSLRKSFCWGNNTFGQLGISSTIQQNIPTAMVLSPLATGERFTSIKTGYGVACGITSLGNTFCWGTNAYGDLGIADDNVSSRNIPSAVSVPTMNGEKFLQLDTGWGTQSISSPVCAITDKGSPYCWGINTKGQLGDGTKYNQFTPTLVNKSTLLSGNAFVALTTGGTQTCGITSTGSTLCWGQNLSGQLGDDTVIGKSLPTILNQDNLPGESFVSVRAGVNFTCGISSHGKTYCWGFNGFGQLGNNTTTDRLKPTQINSSNMASGERFTSLHVGVLHTCGLTGLANAYCWGLNTEGNLGNGTLLNRHLPLAVSMTNLATNEKFKDLAAGYDHTCGLTNLGNAFCWGNNSTGQLGDGTNVSQTVPTTTVSTAGLNTNERFTSLTAGAGYTCGITSQGRSFCWGDNSSGQLGDNTFVNKNVPTLVSSTNLSSGESLIKISAGNKITCGSSNLGQTYCWGLNTNGQVGNNTTLDQAIPVLVSMASLPTGSRFGKISSASASTNHLCGITAEGTGACWGANSYSQLGINSTTDQLMPTPFIFP